MKTLLMTLWVMLALASFAFIYRYDCLMINDVSLKTPIMNDVSLNNEVHRPIRFDRWTGKVEIYLKEDRWSDLAEWNEEKYQSIQSSVKELSSV